MHSLRKCRFFFHSTNIVHKINAPFLFVPQRIKVEYDLPRPRAFHKRQHISQSHNGFISLKKALADASAFCGAGYGNRTRLCGLGSDHSTDELTLRFLYYTRKGGQFQYPFCIQDPTSGSRPQRAKDRQKHLTAFEINCGQVKIRDNNSNSKSNRKSKSVRIRVSKRKKKRKTNNKNICAESCPKRERER